MSEDQNIPTDSDEAAERFVDHFEPILCETDEDRELFASLAELVCECENGDGDLRVKLENYFDGVSTVICEPPYEGDVDPSVPASFVELAAHHNGITWEMMGPPVGFPGLQPDGGLDTYSFEPDFLDQEAKDALAAEGLDPDDVREALLAGQNWIVFDPIEENARGESTLAFVDHNLGELQPIPEAEDLGTGQVVLRLLAYDFLEDDSLDPVWC